MIGELEFQVRFIGAFAKTMPCAGGQVLSLVVVWVALKHLRDEDQCAERHGARDMPGIYVGKECPRNRYAARMV